MSCKRASAFVFLSQSGQLHSLQVVSIDLSVQEVAQRRNLATPLNNLSLINCGMNWLYCSKFVYLTSLLISRKVYPQTRNVKITFISEFHLTQCLCLYQFPIQVDLALALNLHELPSVFL